MSNETRNTHLVVMGWLLITIGTTVLAYRSGFEKGRQDFAKEIMTAMEKLGVTVKDGKFQHSPK